MTDIIKNLMELNIVLPEPSKPVANYSPFVIENKRIYVSGQIPIKKGVLLYKGKAGKDIISSSDLVLGLFDQQDIPTFRHTNQMTTNQNDKSIDKTR